MSRERALRRARHAEERARLAAQADRRGARAARRRARKRIVLDALPQRGRRHGQRGRLAARRRMQNGVIALLFFAVLLVLWLLADSWWARIGGTVIAVLALPVFVTLALDRRSRP